MAERTTGDAFGAAISGHPESIRRRNEAFPKAWKTYFKPSLCKSCFPHCPRYTAGWLPSAVTGGHGGEGPDRSEGDS